MDDTTRDALLFVVEVSQASLEPENCVKTALNAALECLRSSMLATPHNSIGMLLYGAQGHRNACLPLLPLGVQDSAAVKNLMRLCESKAYLESLVQPEAYKLADVFFAAGQQFEKIDQKTTKRITWICTNDDPVPDARHADAAQTRCKDLVEKGILVTPLFIYTPTAPFDVQKFWERLSYAPYNYPQPLLEPCTLDSLEAGVLASSVPKRTMFSCKVYLQGKAIANVKGYNLFQPRKQAVPVSVQVEGEQQKVAETKTTLVVIKSGKEVQKQDCKYGIKLGSEVVGPIDTEQLEKLRFFEDPQIRILSVIDQDLCKFMPHTRHSTFIYPFEGDLSGSTRAFTALWQTLLKKKQYAIASATLRKTSAPFKCLLVPTQAAYYNNAPTVQQYPSGLHIVPIPTTDSMRQLGDLPARDPVDPGKAQKLESIAGDLVRKLTMAKGYDPLRYHNPYITWQDDVIEAAALSLPMPRQVVDNTKPKYKSIQQRAGIEIDALNRAIDGDHALKIPKTEPPN